EIVQLGQVRGGVEERGQLGLTPAPSIQQGPDPERDHPGLLQLLDHGGGRSGGAGLPHGTLELDARRPTRPQFEKRHSRHVPQCALHPPSSISEVPVMNDACGEHKYTTSSATSSGSINRLIAVGSSMIFATTSSSLRLCALAWASIWRSTRAVRT